jgi:hypothetical protein
MAGTTEYQTGPHSLGISFGLVALVSDENLRNHFMLSVPVERSLLGLLGES